MFTTDDRRPMFEFLIEILGELLIQIGLEAFMEFGLRGLVKPFCRWPYASVAVVGYLLLGATAGGATLLVFPAHLIREPAAQVLNLVVTPLIAGLAMCLLGQWRARRGDTMIRIDRFWYAYLFALAVAVTRFGFAR